MDLSVLNALGVSEVRQFLPGYLSGFITDPTANLAANEAITTLTQSWSDDEIEAMLRNLRDVGEEQQLYLADPRARQLSRIWAKPLLKSITLEGLSHLEQATASGPTAILCNHTSYMDSSTIDTILAENHAESLANKIVSAAGPKVYSTLFRRFAAMCLNTLPVPQSNSLGHTARMSPRELAKLALASMKLAHESMNAGHVLLIFPEGSRTRTGQLQPFLQGVYRYLALEGLQVVPTALVGCGEIMNLENEQCVPGPVSLTFGKPIPVTTKSDAKDALNASFEALSQILPNNLQPI